MRNKLIRQILSSVEDDMQYARSLIIIGEFGSGKSWLARQIHNISNRYDKPFIPVNCYTLEEQEARKTIFGYLAFTENGVKINKGILEQCNGGTLLLKGFDSFSEKLQEQILESLEQNETHHVGSQYSIPIDVHTIISIDIDLMFNANAKYNLIRSIKGDYHEAVFYPPLRHRRDEIDHLIDLFLTDDLAGQYSFISQNISPRALYQCICYDWPGNVKQLKNAIEHAAIISAGNSIQPEHLPLSVKSGQPDKKRLKVLERDGNFKEAEKKLLLKVLQQTVSREQTARLLGINTKSLAKKIEAYGLLDQQKNG